MVLSFIRRKRGEVIQAEHVNELQIAAEQLDAEKAAQTAVDALETEVAAKLPIADVLNEPDMATGATDKPPSQASVVEYVTEGLASKVSGEESSDSTIDHGFVGADDLVSWLAGTAAGLMPPHSQQIVAEAVAPLLQDGLLSGLPEEMPGESGWDFAIVDTENRIALGIREDGTVFPGSGDGGTSSAPDPVEPLLGSGTGLLVREPSGGLRPYTSTTDVSFWGDSLIQGWPVPPFEADRSNSMPGAFADLHGSGTVFNFGYTGKTADEITIRQGGLVIELEPSGGEIPASGAVTVTTPQDVGWRPGSVWSCEGTLAGVAGTLTWSGSALSFERDSAGSAVPVTEPTPFVSTVGEGRGADITVVLMGRNDVSYLSSDPRIVDRVVAANIALIDSLTPRYPRFLLLGTITRTTEPAGHANHTRVVAINAELKRRFPDNFLDLRRWLIDEAMDVMGLTPDADDLENIANDTIPPSLMADITHYTPDAAAAIAEWLHDEMTSRGWI